MIIEPGKIKTGELHAYMLSSIAPRPIAFASTMDKNGNPNLSPFSFFNAFGSNPPILVFSPARRVRDNTIKHTLENVLETKEVVINVVNYNMVQQTSLSSCEYPRGVSEFEKAGFTPEQINNFAEFEIIPDPTYIQKIADSHKKFARIYKNNSNETIYGYLLPFTLHAHPQVQKFIWECGIGIYTTQGYGMVDVVGGSFIEAPADVIPEE